MGAEFAVPWQHHRKTSWLGASTFEILPVVSRYEDEDGGVGHGSSVLELHDVSKGARLEHKLRN